GVDGVNAATRTSTKTWTGRYGRRKPNRAKSQSRKCGTYSAATDRAPETGRDRSSHVKIGRTTRRDSFAWRRHLRPPRVLAGGPSKTAGISHARSPLQRSINRLVSGLSETPSPTPLNPS